MPSTLFLSGRRCASVLALLVAAMVAPFAAAQYRPPIIVMPGASVPPLNPNPAGSGMPNMSPPFTPAPIVETVWICKRCGKEVSRGPIAPIGRTCPGCGVLFVSADYSGAGLPPTMPQGSMPAGSMPQGSMPAGSMPQGSMPQGSMPQGSMPMGSTPAANPAMSSNPSPASTPFSSPSSGATTSSGSSSGGMGTMVLGVIIIVVGLVVLGGAACLIVFNMAKRSDPPRRGGRRRRRSGRDDEDDEDDD